MKPPHQMISQDEAKLYRERAEKAEAEVARLRAAIAAYLVLPTETERLALRAALATTADQPVKP